jgi:hypothetical protein
VAVEGGGALVTVGEAATAGGGQLRETELGARRKSPRRRSPHSGTVLT